MEINKLFSWKDIERIIWMHRPKWQEYANRIVVYSDLIEVSLKEDDWKDNIKYIFSELFGKNYDAEREAVLLEWNYEELSVDFTGEEPEKSDKHIPLFRKILYKNSAYDNEAEKQPLLNIPVTVFHSYKGGVGRTLSLLAFAKAWSEKQPVDKRSLLIIDSDIEAPGLTWLQNEPVEQHYSYLDLLEAIQNRNVERYMEDILRQIKKSTLGIETAKEKVE